MKTSITSLTGKSILALVLVLLFFTPAFALTPEIYSIEPDHGTNKSSTEMTIHGANFEATPKVALYGGGPQFVGGVTRHARQAESSFLETTHLWQVTPQVFR